MADERLPRVVERLRRGDDVDVPAESPPPGTSTIQEISQIAESFGTVQAAAVAAAVDQARLRKGVNQVFLNISMRNQSLLHRQLGMLDSMERRTSEPEALADLFRLDHLTTRMRRHAEGLIILSGSIPGRGWRDPVPVVDILRAAVAEVEDYVRVDVVSESATWSRGTRSTTSFTWSPSWSRTPRSSPRPTPGSRSGPTGWARAWSPRSKTAALACPTKNSPTSTGGWPARPSSTSRSSEQLGLFVVSQLAARHDIKVSLRRSVYGGTTAVVLLPFGVVVREEEAPPSAARETDRPDDSGTRGLTRTAPAWPPRAAATGSGRGARADGGTGMAAAASGLSARALGGRADGRPAARTLPALPSLRGGVRPAPAPWDPQARAVGRRGRPYLAPRPAGRPGARHGRTEPVSADPAGAPPATRAARSRRRPAAISGCPSGFRRPAWPRSCGPGEARPAAGGRARRPTSTRDRRRRPAT